MGISEQIQTFELEPTSLKRGEGLISMLQRMLEGKIGGEGEGGGSGMGGGCTNLNSDGVDLSFKLRSPSKIMLDINAGWLDKKIKIYITLEVL